MFQGYAGPEIMKRKGLYRTLLFGLFGFYCLSFPVHSQESSSSGKKGSQILIEEELQEEFQNLDEAEAQDEIIVLGEDEQIIRPHKETAVMTPPPEVESLRWVEIREILDKPGKNLGLRKDMMADARFFYGNRYSLGFDGDFLRQDQGKNFRVKYKRQSFEGRAPHNEPVNNSAFTMDDFTYTESRKLTGGYSLSWKINYLGVASGLEENAVYRSSLRNAALAQLDQVLRFHEAHRIEVSLNTEYIESRFLPVPGGIDYNTQFYRGWGSLSWQYFFGKRNQLMFDIDSSYSVYDYRDAGIDQTEEQLSQNESFGLLRVLLPLYLGYAGVSQLPFQADLILGGSVYYEPGFDLFPGPYMQLVSRFGEWNSLLTVKRSNRLPDHGRLLASSPYYKPVKFSSAVDGWYASWENGFLITEKDHIHIDLTGQQFSQRYQPALDADGLYYLELIDSEQFAVQLGYERELSDNLFAEFGVRYEYFKQAVNLEPSLVAKAILTYEPQLWFVSLIISYVEARVLDSVSYDAAFLVDLEMRYRLSRHSELMLIGRDLADSDYQSLPPYSAVGRNIYAGLYLRM